MEAWLENFAGSGKNVLVTTAANRDECQAWEYWDRADVIIRVDDRGAKILLGEIPA